MKSIIAFVVLIVGISALPKFNQIDMKNERLVTDSIAAAIQDVSQSIRDVGLDPFHIASDSNVIELPVPVIFKAASEVEEFLFTGLSNIVINNLNYGLLTSRLTFDIELPSIELTLNKADVDVVLFGKDYSASASGRLAISRVRVAGNVRVSLGIISGISIRSVSVDFTLGGIESAVNVSLFNVNISDSLNTFLGTTIPSTLRAFSAEINELLEIIVEDVGNSIL